jgi:PAS domain S-box-containing protein
MVEFPIITKNGEERWIAHHCSPVFDETGNYAGRRGNNRDITKRKQAEAQLKLQAHALESAANAIAITDDQGNILWANPAFSTLTGFPLEEALGENPRFLKSGQHDEAFYKQMWDTILTGDVWQGEIVNKRKDGALYTEEMTIAPLISDDGQITNFVAIKQDITERKETEEVAKQHVERLRALRKIDEAISNSLDLKVTLHVLLDYLLAQLGVDAATVLLYEKSLQELTFSQGQGFHTAALKKTILRLGDGYAGKVALKREDVFIPDLIQATEPLSKSPLFEEEGFVAYYGVPLIAKGTLVGVLEIFNRSSLAPNDEWVSYLHTLAGQAAIAIDNISLFNDLQRSNTNLLQAYNATIEGWAQALELRDMETEGHSRRVVKITMALAKKQGIKGQDLVNTQRGALLHDIGKMGIPDAILQKPGKLNAEEWKIMKLHPVYAFEWLSSIEYLRPALDIPHYHHEKWDGTGYPDGLKAEQIPIAARIFAIVDVWDALLSDRPYRKAWPREKTLAYIQEESGKYFDPEVVDAFLHLIKGRDNPAK